MDLLTAEDAAKILAMLPTEVGEAWESARQAASSRGRCGGCASEQREAFWLPLRSRP